MPNIKSAKKRLLQSEKRRLRNRTVLVSTRNMIKRLEKADKTTALQMLPKVVSMLDKLVNRNIIHRNNAANKKSRLTRLVNKLAA